MTRAGPFDIRMPQWRTKRRGYRALFEQERQHTAYDAFAGQPVFEKLHLVTDASDQSDRRAVQTCARYFQREFRYDFLQYSVLESDPMGRAFVWTDDQNRLEGLFVVGAVSFRWREYTDAPAAYVMQWIWLHPYFRRCGFLTEAWPFFRARFGNFYCEEPLSDAMSAFLERISRKEPP